MLKAVLFDLDGTLLPMDQKLFTKDYFGRLMRRICPCGYTPETFLTAMQAGIDAMVKNDNSRSNEEAFWEAFAAVCGQEILQYLPNFERFYEEEFDEVAPTCGHTPEAAALVRGLTARGVRVALATNPLFPRIATEKRIAWAGLDKADFACVTTYENSRYSKPNPAYYLDVAKRIGIPPEECVMVGNDAVEDLAAREAGMDVFLLVGGLLNRKGVDISAVPQGGFGDLLSYLKAKLAD